MRVALRQLCGRATAITAALQETVTQRAVVMSASALELNSSSSSTSASGSSDDIRAKDQVQCSSSSANSADAALLSSTASKLHSASAAAASHRSAAVVAAVADCTGASSSSTGSSRGSYVSATSSNQDSQFSQNESQHSKQADSEVSSGSSPPEPVDRHVQCTRDIKATQTPQELLTVLQQRAADMNHISLSAAYNQATRLCRNNVMPEQQPEEVQQLLQVLHQLAGQLQQQCGPRELSNVMVCCARLYSVSTVKQLLQEFLQESNLQKANPQDVSTTLRTVEMLHPQSSHDDSVDSTTVLATAGSHVQLAEGEAQQLVQQVIAGLSEASAQDAVSTLCYVATFNMQLPEGEVRQLLGHVVDTLQFATARCISKTLRAAAILGVRPAEDELQQLFQHFFRALPAAKSRDVADVLRAAATHNVQLTEGEVRLLVRHVVDTLQTAKPSHVSETLRAAAILGVRPAEGDMQQLMQRFLQMLPAANAVHVADVLRAAATWNVQLEDEEVRQLVRHLVHLLPHVSPYSVANSMWAVASLGVRPAWGDVQQLMQHVAQMSSIQPYHVSSILRALAAMEHRPTAQQLAHLLECLEPHLFDARPQDIANVVLACGLLRFAPLQLLSKLEQQPVQLGALVAGLTPRQAAKIAWAYGQLGHRGEQLPGLLLQQAVTSLQDGNAELYDLFSLTMLCWSAAMLDLQQYVPHVLQLAAACKQGLGSAEPIVLRQLSQVHLWLQTIQMSSTGLATQPMGLLSVLSQQEVQQCMESWEQALTDGLEIAQASALQKSLFAAAQAQPEGTWQHPGPVWQQRTADNAFVIDVAATSSSGVRGAIEMVDSDNIIQPYRNYTGSTLFKHRALAAKGYVLVIISSSNWGKARYPEMQQKYLHTVLQAALQSAAPSRS